MLLHVPCRSGLPRGVFKIDVFAKLLEAGWLEGAWPVADISAKPMARILALISTARNTEEFALILNPSSLCFLTRSQFVAHWGGG